MPSNAYRLEHLHRHSIRAAGGRPPDLQRAVRLHPDWAWCCRCRFPVDPVVDGHACCYPDVSPTGDA